MSSTEPIATILMPVYNGASDLHTAINSILHQTFSNFEFLIIDDGSTDNSSDIIESYNDPRIRFFRNLNNLGIAQSLNNGIKLSQGKYIARMDCDDLSHPKRLEKQIRFLEQNPEVVACGTWVRAITKSQGNIWTYPEEHDEIFCHLLFGSALAHPSVVLRKEALIRNGLFYNESLDHVEDYELWIQITNKNLKLANLGEVLLEYKCESSLPKIEQRKNADILRAIQIEKLGISPTFEELYIHNSIGHYDYTPNKDFLISSQSWLEKIYQANQKARIYSPQPLLKTLSSKWLEIIQNSTCLGLWTWKQYFTSSFKKSAQLELEKQAKLFAKCIINQS